MNKSMIAQIVNSGTCEFPVGVWVGFGEEVLPAGEVVGEEDGTGIADGGAEVEKSTGCMNG
jgi:hypothetical protein